MIFRRSIYTIKKSYLIAVNRIARIGLNTNYLLFIVISAFGILFLSYNIYKAVKRGETNYEVMLQEQVKRDKLAEQNDVLGEELIYYESPDAKRNMATEGYKYAEPSENLYEFDREPVEFDYIEKPIKEEIDFSNHEDWWRMILL